MKNDDPAEREAVAGLLASARKQHERVRIALEALVEKLNGDDLTENKQVSDQLKDFKKSLEQVIDIETNLAKQSYKQRGVEGACELDLAAARQEVIERLNRRART